MSNCNFFWTFISGYSHKNNLYVVIHRYSATLSYRPKSRPTVDRNDQYYDLQSHSVQRNNLRWKKNLMFCWPCIIVYQYNETNMMHFWSNLLRIKASACFEHYLLTLRRCCTNGVWYIAWYIGCGTIAVALQTPNWHYTHAMYQMLFVQRLLRMSK
jgi:hypothetical protein